jgi:hypothetical protein
MLIGPAYVSKNSFERQNDGAQDVGSNTADHRNASASYREQPDRRVMSLFLAFRWRRQVMLFTAPPILAARLQIPRDGFDNGRNCLRASR